MAKSISVAQSRFAVLTIDDDDEVDRKSNKKQQAKTNEQSGQQKKKKSKGKQKQQEESDLKQMAFGARPARHHKNSNSEINKSRKGNNSSQGGEGAVQWEEWRQKDEEFANDVYERDLEQALLASKVDFEQNKQKVKPQECQQSNGHVSEKEGKRNKKKKDKPQPMSLGEFNQLPNAPQDEGTVETPPPRVPALDAGEGDAKFFDNVENDVHKILQKERIQEEYKKHYVIENAITSKYQEELATKDLDISNLRGEVKILQDELKQVKKRNKQLCVILAQGEMKDKAQVLMQVEDLTQVRDELTEQVSQLTADLEKEKSKVHALKTELDRLKGGRHHSGK